MLQGWVRSRWGKRGSILLAIVLGLWGAWTQRENIAALPGVKQVIVWLEQQPAPKPSPGKFNLAVAALGNDPSDDMRRLILDEAKQFSGVAALSPGEMIEIQGGNSEQAIQAGHERARKLLAKMGADVMLWGEVIRHENQSRPRLYWTAAREVVLSKPTERYKIEDMALPALFWDDFKSVLGLIVASHDEELWQLEGHYIGR